MTDVWPEPGREDFVFECDEFDGGRLSGCVGCGAATWLNGDAVCPDCYADDLTDLVEEQLELDAARLTAIAMDLDTRADTLRRVPRALVQAKAEHLRVSRHLRSLAART